MGKQGRMKSSGKRSSSWTCGGASRRRDRTRNDRTGSSARARGGAGYASQLDMLCRRASRLLLARSVQRVARRWESGWPEEKYRENDRSERSDSQWRDLRRKLRTLHVKKVAVHPLFRACYSRLSCASVDSGFGCTKYLVVGQRAETLLPCPDRNAHVHMQPLATNEPASMYALRTMIQVARTRAFALRTRWIRVFLFVEALFVSQIFGFRVCVCVCVCT